MSDLPLSAPEGAVVRLSAALGSRSGSSVRSCLEDAARDAPPQLVEEAILQSYLFLGYPAALNAFMTWRKVSGRPPTTATEDDPEAWRGRGARVCRTVYGGQYERLRDNVRALHPDMERWMIVEGYGKVLGREGMELELRELCIVALLAALDAPRQLYSHLRGALNAGSSPGRIQAALAIAAEESGTEPNESAFAIWDAVLQRQSRP